MRYAVPFALVAFVLSAPAAAQQPSASETDPSAPTQSSTSAAAQARTSGDSLRVDITPELQRTLDELAATLDRLGRRIANDPELRNSAVRAAQSFVGVAQLIVVQQADLLQEALRAASDRLATLSAPQPLRH